MQAPEWISSTEFNYFCKQTHKEIGNGSDQSTWARNSSGYQANDESESRRGIQNTEIHCYGTKLIHKECSQTDMKLESDTMLNVDGLFLKCLT